MIYTELQRLKLFFYSLNFCVVLDKVISGINKRNEGKYFYGF